MALAGKGRWNEAIASFRKAIELDPKDAKIHYSLGLSLANKGQVDEPITCWRKAIELDPNFASAHDNLGASLARKGRMDEAIACFQKAIALDPKNPRTHCNLGAAMTLKGQGDEAIACFQKAIALDPKLPGIRIGLAQAQRVAAAQGKLRAFLKGDFKPTTNGDRLTLCKLCTIKKRYRTSVGLYAEAFATDARLADDLKASHRYNAACFAALAAAGQGEDAAKLDDQEKARLRKQALDWLRADLALHAKQLKSGQPVDRPAAQEALRHWQKDSDLAGLRDAAALAKLQPEERAAYERLWADVAALLKRAGGETK